MNSPISFSNCIFLLAILFFPQILQAQNSKQELIQYYLTNIRDKNTVEEKLPLLEEAIEVFTERNDLKSVAGFNREKGLMFLIDDQLDSSLVAYNKAIMICELIRDSIDLAGSLNSAAGVLVELNRYSEARIYCQRALDIQGDLGNTSLFTCTLNALGVIYQYEGNIES